MQLYGRPTVKGFTLIELMIVLVIISTLTVMMINEYAGHTEQARITKVKMDLEELTKAIRLYNIREDQQFRVATFTLQYLGRFVGTYLEKEPPNDPWGHPYKHNPDRGIVYSIGPDGIDAQQLPGATFSDDIVMSYLPQEFFILRAEYVDANNNNLIDFGDRVDIYFSRPAQMNNVSVFDFPTKNPEGALGSAIVVSPPRGNLLSFLFAPPVPPSLRLGETTIAPREFIESVVDCSIPPKPLKKLEDVMIQKKRM